MPVVLNVDDSEEDQFLLSRAVKKSGAPFRLELVNDGQKAIQYFSGQGKYSDRQCFPLPDVLLLDLKMPVRTGFDVLEWLQTQPQIKPCHVAVFSSSQNSADVQKAYALGAKWYLMKPVEYTELIQLVKILDAFLARSPGKDLKSFSTYIPADDPDRPG